MAWNCTAYFDFLFDRTPHFDDRVERDWWPIDDAWVGQIEMMKWEPRTGTEHTWDRVHVGAPDLTGCWEEVSFQDETCVDNACNPASKTVSWGSTRKTYTYSRQRVKTIPLCFDQINTRAKANEQVSSIVDGLKDIVKMYKSDFFRRNSLQKADFIYIAGDANASVPIVSDTFNVDCTEIDLGSADNVPTSQLTIPYLQRQWAPLQYNGYFRSKFVPAGMMKLITDPIVAWQLEQGNPALVEKYRFTDFTKGGELFKYGMSTAVGNFGIAYDAYPMRFNHIGGGVLRRVFPYVNANATIGIKRQFDQAYEEACIQYSPIWHPSAMQALVPTLQSVSPEAPFFNRDLFGKWYFLGGNRDRTFIATDPATGDSCTIDNTAGNQGLWWTDMNAGIKFVRPELVRGILHLREPGCIVNDPRCTPCPTTYAPQNFDQLVPCQEIT
jgi:hypothetical protein